MDYKKKYKQLHTLISDLYPFMSEYCKEKVEGFFPELAESESERIRKELLKFLEGIWHLGKNAPFEKWDKSDCSKWIAWLEKQGESYTKRDVDDAWLKGMCDAKRELEKQGDSPIKWNKNTKDCKPKVSHSVLMKTTHGIAEGEWQGEHWHQYRWAALVRDADVLSWMELSDLEKQSEQKSQRMISAEAKEAMYDKPAWSEEDEKMLADACIMLDWYQGNNWWKVQHIKNWLKSLKERIGG